MLSTLFDVSLNLEDAHITFISQCLQRAGRASWDETSGEFFNRPQSDRADDILADRPQSDRAPEVCPSPSIWLAPPTLFDWQWPHRFYSTVIWQDPMPSTGNEDSKLKREKGRKGRRMKRDLLHVISGRERLWDEKWCEEGGKKFEDLGARPHYIVFCGR